MLKKLPQVLHIHLHLQKTVRFTHGAAIHTDNLVLLMQQAVSRQVQANQQ